MAGRVDLPEQYPSYRWAVMGVWLACSSSGWMAVVNLGILLPSITEDLSLSPSQQGMLGSVAAWGNLALAVPLSWWISRYSPKMVTTASQLLATVCAFGQGLAPSFPLLLVARLGLGISLISREPARALLTQQWFPQREIPLVSVLANMAYNFVVGGGLAITPLILTSLDDDWRRTFYVFGGLFTVLLVLWVALGRERITTEYRRREVPRDVGLLRGALSYRDLWLAGFGFVGATMTYSTFVNFYPTMMLERYNLSLQWSGTLMALYLIVGAVSGFGVVHLATKMNQGKAVLQVLGLLMAGTFFGMTLTGNIPLLLVLSLLNGLTWGFWPILFTVPFQLPGIRNREVAVAFAFVMMSTASGTALGPLAAGFLEEEIRDLRLTLWIITFGCLSLTISGALMRPSAAGLSATQRDIAG